MRSEQRLNQELIYRSLHLVRELWHQLPVAEELQDDGVSKTEAGAWLRVPAKGGQQAVIAAAARDRAKLAPPIECLEHDSCTHKVKAQLLNKKCVVRHPRMLQ